VLAQQCARGMNKILVKLISYEKITISAIADDYDGGILLYRV
jgi:hypothetical protein